jgi:energy-coupling factor transporter ATP-binding protein EcfA2
VTTRETKLDGDVLDALKALGSQASLRNKNEAETRHHIIDFILHDFLSWPRNRVAVEEYIHPGFADYILKKADGGNLIFIEAKKEGIFFELPLSHSQDETSAYISIAKLISDANIKAALSQVRTYCFDTGCEYAAITNGHEWVFFKTFERGKRWESLQAFVVRSLRFFEREYTKATNNLSYTAIVERSSLPSLLSSTPPKDRTIYYPKEKIASYSHSITANRLANTLRPVVNHYFGVIRDDDTEFMDRCYVSQREYTNTSQGMRALIHDSLSPYFQSYGVQQLDDTGKGGRLGGRLTKNIRKGRKGEVLVLFGGKGSGKSTFIKRLLHHKPPRWLSEHSVISIVDLLETPEDQTVIRSEIWGKLVSQLDREGILASERETLISTLFPDRFLVAQRQELFGLAESSDVYQIALNNLVSVWKSDLSYCAKKLVEHWNKKSKGVIVIIDNTDQYASAMQDFCFTSAQEISKLLECVTLISMREERFHSSKIHGLLDAFQNAGFHISSPRPSEVFKKRLEYTISLLTSERRRALLIPDADEQFVKDSVVYLNILVKEFSNDRSPLNAFLTACAHGNIRLSLDLFRSFLLSGYTNVDEMISNGSWNFQVHQVIKPVMIPTRYFYDETLSEIPNVYQLRNTRHASHFTALRILRKLAKNFTASAPSYMSTATLVAYFAETFNMADDCVENLDLLLRHGLIESNNRLDYYTADVDQVKITSYGLYIVEDFAYIFAYLDLICTDCGIFDQEVGNYLLEAARTEYRHFTRGERIERVRVRLDRVEKFVDYLHAEELRERDFYSLGMPDDEMFTFKALELFKAEKGRVMKSAEKQKRRSSPRRTRRTYTR